MILSLSSEVWGPPISGICGPPSCRFEGFPSLESGVFLPSCAPYLWIRQWPQPFCLYSPLKEFWNPVYPFLGKRLKILIVCLNHFKRFIFLHILYCPPSSNTYCIKILELQILAYPVHVMEMTKPVFALTSVSEIRPLLVEDVSVPRRRQWQPTPLLLPGESHGWRSLVGCGPWGLKESDMTERLHFHFSLSRTGEGNGRPLQCSCLENPRDGGAWWTAVYGVAQSRTRLKRLSSSSSSSSQVDHLSSEPESWHGPGRGLSWRQVAVVDGRMSWCLGSLSRSTAPIKVCLKLSMPHSQGLLSNNASWNYPFSGVLEMEVAQRVKSLPVMQATWVWSLVQEIPWKRKWQPTPIFFSGKSHGWRSLEGYYSPWDRRVRHDWVTNTFRDGHTPERLRMSDRQ